MTLYPQNAGDIAFIGTISVFALLAIVCIAYFGMTTFSLFVLIFCTLFGGLVAAKVEKAITLHFEKRDKQSSEHRIGGEDEN